MGNTTYAGLPWPEPSAFLGQANLHIRSLAESLDQRWVGAALARTANQAITTGSWVNISWSTGINTPAVGGALTNSADGVTVPAAGVYAVTASAQFEANATGTRQLQITQGTFAIGTDFPDIKNAASGILTGLLVARVLRLPAGAAINAQVQHSAGAAINLVRARIEVYRIA